MKFDWILFDADHTLFDFDKSAAESLKLTLKEYGHSAKDEYYPAYYEINKNVWREFEEGKINRETLRTKRFTEFFKLLGISYPPGEFNAAYLAKLPSLPYFMDGAIALLEDVQKTHKLGIITNGLQEVQRPRLVQCGAIKYFNLIVISGEIGHAKPNPEYFDYAYTHMDQPDKDRVLVVGDNIYSDIKGGADYGFKTCWFNPHGQENGEEVIPDFEIRNLRELYSIID